MNALVPNSLGCCQARGLGDAACATAAELAAEKKRRVTAEQQRDKRAGQVAAMQAEIADLERRISAARAARATTPATPRPATPAPAAPAAPDPNCPTEADVAAERTKRNAAQAQALKRAQEVGAMQAEIADLERQLREWTQKNNAKYRERNQALVQQNTELRTGQEQAQTRIIEAAINADRDAAEIQRNQARDAAPPAGLAPVVITSQDGGGQAATDNGQSVLLLGAVGVGLFALLSMSRKGRRR